MKKRYAAGLALALVGILSGCGQTKTQPADNTISITPVEQATTEKQSGAVVEYHFSGNNTEANGWQCVAEHGQTYRCVWYGSE